MSHTEAAVMTFNDYLNRAWQEHGTDPEKTAASLEEGLALCTSANDIVSLVHLTTHLYSEHLHKFIEGERKLREFGKSDFVVGSPAEFAIARSVMAFRLCDGSIDPEHDRAGLTPGDLARSLAIATSALSTRESARAEKYLRQALSLVSSLELDAKDGIARGLAIAGNNSAANLEELPSRTEQQTSLMLLAAETGRKFWEIAGSWMEVERAEYRWAKSCLAAGMMVDALEHAKLCLSICEQNHAPALEFFFAYECLASIEKRAGSDTFEAMRTQAAEWFGKIGPDDQSWAKASLAKLG